MTVGEHANATWRRCAGVIAIGEGELTLEELVPHLRAHGPTQLQDIQGISTGALSLDIALGGKGLPRGLQGDAVLPAVRLITLAQDAIALSDASGVEPMAKI